MRKISTNPLTVKAVTANAAFLCSSAIRFVFIMLVLVSANTLMAQNAIVTENAQLGTPAAVWDINGAGDESIEGFATDMSVNKGERIRFKINTDASNYSIEIYRIGYYQGNGARRVGTGIVSAALPQTQPTPLYQASTGLTDCGNWAESGYWDVPASAVSGVYIAKLTRTDDGGASHIIFVVRDDAGTASMYFKTSDATWQAYNPWGGKSAYGTYSDPPVPGFSHATKMSYNRPFNNRASNPRNSFFNAEYPMVRWLERNGYETSYTTDVDADRRGNLITRHKVFISVGHDEYWSAAERNYVTVARNAGVHLAMLSGNEIYWKTRWEAGIDGTNISHRTLVCYKEGREGDFACGSKCDPLPNIWTGLWRSGCEYPQADGCLPENALSGQMSWTESTGSIVVPNTYKDFRFWRNTAVAALGVGQAVTLSNGTLGYEWDFDQYFDSYPPGRVTISSTTINRLTHKISLYRKGNALVFGAGTVQWSWGLDGIHDQGISIPDPNLQQATVNLFADMGVQPGSLQTELIRAIGTIDNQAPTSIINAPVINATVFKEVPVTITGTALDVGGVVAGVEISIDGGATWQMAVGTTNWSLSWTPQTEGRISVKSRAFDDLGNIENTAILTLPNIITVNVSPAPLPVCPCSIFRTTDIPLVDRLNDGQAIEVGVKFRSTENGRISGIRFYKGVGSTGRHLGHLWNSSGTLLADAIFVNETASGWQQVLFSAPVPITNGTTYIASIHSSSGDYAQALNYFTLPVTNRPLVALQNGQDGLNGVYTYSPNTAFPTNSYLSSNYYVDVVFNLNTPSDVTAPSVTITSPTNGATGITINTVATVTFSELMDPATINSNTIELRNPANTLIPATVSYNATTKTATITPTAPLVHATQYLVRIKGGTTAPVVKDVAGNALSSNYIFVFTTITAVAPVVTSHPLSQTVCSGSPVSFASSAIGSPTPTVQWQQNVSGSSTWTNISGATIGTLTFTPVAADNQKNYRAVWTNVGGTATSSSAKLTVTVQFTATVSSKTNTKCGGNNGAITISKSGGISPFTHSLNSGAFQTDNVFDSLAAGTYSVLIKDAKGCTATITGIVIASSTGPTVRVVSKTSAGCGDDNGSLVAAASGGTSPYMYSLNNGTYRSSATFSNLAGGTYTLNARDASGCITTLTGVIITEVQTIKISLASKGNTYCGFSTGYLSVTATNGIGDYDYSLNNGSFRSSGRFTGLSAGTYSVIVRDDQGCRDTLTNIVISSYGCYTLAPSTKTIKEKTGVALNQRGELRRQRGTVLLK